MAFALLSSQLVYRCLGDCGDDRHVASRSQGGSRPHRPRR
jgi:hypothetical protein